jgi:hypothetical protein
MLQTEHIMKQFPMGDGSQRQLAGANETESQASKLTDHAVLQVG